MAATETSARANEVLDELYRQHVGDVYRYTYAVLGNHADAEDVTQTTFVNALRALERGETPDEPSRWLTVIAHNLVRQRWRQAASRPALVELQTDVPDAPDDDQGFELEELVRALQRIPETQREAIVMRELEGRSYREIATVLGLSTSALETLLFRARRSLVDELENVVTCQNAELSISKRLDGRLSRKERRRLEEHLADCPDCTRLAATQQRQRRAFKGLALLPLPIGLALFKGAPSAAAATSLPTIGLAATGAGTSGTGAAGAAGAGATAATTTGGAAVGGSLAGGLVVKVAAVVVTAAVATGVGYKGVQAVRDTPAKPAPADVKPTPKRLGAPTRAATIGVGGAISKPAEKPHGNAKRHGPAHAKAVTSPGRAKHGAPPPPGLAGTTSPAATGHANGAGNDQSTAGKTHVTGQAKPKHVDSAPPAPGPKRTPAPKQPKQPKAEVGNPNAVPKQAPPQSAPADTPAPAQTTSDPAAAPVPQSGDTTSAAPAGAAPTGAESSTQTTTQAPPSTSTPPSATPSTPTDPAAPPTDTTGTPPESTDGPSNNGWDDGKKLGHYNENQDGKHLVTS